MAQALDVDETLIDAVCTRLREHLNGDDAGRAEAFARQYYRWVAPEDVAERRDLDLYGAALAHFDLARKREPGSTKLRVYNPEFEIHGWESPHTAVEVVTDDMPFLIDSLGMELNRRGFGVFVIIHPVIQVRRDAEGNLLEVLPHGAEADGTLAESVIHAEVARQTDPKELQQLRDNLMRVIDEVRAAVTDWQAMRAQVLDVVAQLGTDPPPLDHDEVTETRAFLTWLEDHNFIFLGYREYELSGEASELALVSRPETALGILRQEGDKPSSHGFERLPPAVRARALEPYLINLTKANTRATVHRPSYLDYVGIKRFDAEGSVTGERRFLGLYTHTAYQASPREIPILRRKVEAVRERAAFPAESHDDKALIEILESFPRDELFQISVDDLHRISMGILHLGGRQRLRLFIRRDTYDRFFSCLVFVPRDRFNTENRHRIERILRQATGATTIDYSTRVSESVLVRLHFLAYVEPGTLPDVDERKIETLLVAATRSWGDDLEEALVEEYGEERGEALFRRYRDAFPAGYRADWVPRSAVADVARIEELDQPDDLSLRLYRPLEASHNALRAKVFRLGPPLALSALLPLFEDMGVQVADERPYSITPSERETVWIYDFGLTYGGDIELEADRVRDVFQDAFIRSWRGDTESDGYNRLVLRAGLTSREATVLRAIGRYLRQAGTTFSDRYTELALVGHPGVARLLVDLVHRPLRPRVGGRRARRPPRREHRTGDRRGREPRPGPHPAQLPRRRPGDAADELLPARRRRIAQELPVVQARPRAASPAAPPPPALRDLRLLAAHRGRAPARRQGRARRDPLVGPARGLPHRGARADEGADGQERRDRAGRREGRLRAQATAGGRRPRRAARRGRGLLPHLHQRHARPDRQHRRGRDRAAARRRALRRGRPLPGRGGRQGHGRAVRRRQLGRDRLRVLARRRVRVGRLERLRPQADGHHRARRVGVRQAPLPRAGPRRQGEGLHGRRRRRHVGRRVRQRDAAVAGTSAWSPRSTTGTCSSTPTPTPNAASRSASGCSSCRAPRGTTTTAS